MTPGIINRHWYKWLQAELVKLGFDAIAPALPDEKEAKDSIWIPFLLNNIGVAENDILIGHSSGAMAILRVCEQVKVKGLILVSAGYYDHDVDQLWNWNKIKANAQWIEQFHSSDDPFTPVNSSHHIAKEVQTELVKLGFDAIAPALPDEKEAKDSIWIPFLLNNIGVAENDILIGHSSGAMAILRVCEQVKVKGLILVSAGYYDHDVDQLWNWNKIKANAQWIEQFHSSDDPFTPVNSSRHIAKEVQSTYHEFNDRNHFLCTEFPDLIDVIKYRCGLS
ncbi:unnamed protein product [Rotaria sordida]|uniref:Uncharacterized protein n=2 Tax=Rotaria sordida TaxID=392033 RepID=A0A813Z7F5_9BILA|nr:unnamed protein product [Rotaria sordida]